MVSVCVAVFMWPRPQALPPSTHVGQRSYVELLRGRRENLGSEASVCICGRENTLWLYSVYVCGYDEHVCMYLPVSLAISLCTFTCMQCACERSM